MVTLMAKEIDRRQKLEEYPKHKKRQFAMDVGAMFKTGWKSIWPSLIANGDVFVYLPTSFSLT